MNTLSEEKFYEDDEEMQRALMMSATEPQKNNQPTNPPTTTHTTSRTHNAPPTTTSTHPTPQPPQRVYDVDGDVDMAIGEDPELQEALMHSLDKQDAKQPTHTPQLPDKETNRRTRIFGDDTANSSAPAQRTRVYGVDDDDDDIIEETDRELQDALRLSRQVIDVDKEGGRAKVFGGTVEDYPSPAGGGPVITSIDDDGVEVAEDEDAELQKALMSSLNPNASPPQPAHSDASPRIIPRPRVPIYTQPPPDPAVANARRLRNEQDRAYQQSLAEDREKVLSLSTFSSPLSISPSILPVSFLLSLMLIGFIRNVKRKKKKNMRE